jgi:ABC-type antimicrobial peptide transport system permease subunit
MLGIFATIAAGLGAIGTYGVLAYAVARRTNEIGIRMALGGATGDVLRLVLRRGAILGVIGISSAVAGAAGLSRSLTAMLYGLTPLDPMTYVAVTSLFAASPRSRRTFPRGEPPGRSDGCHPMRREHQGPLRT